jgi:hypothetical protein
VTKNPPLDLFYLVGLNANYKESKTQDQIQLLSRDITELMKRIQEEKVISPELEH